MTSTRPYVSRSEAAAFASPQAAQSPSVRSMPAPAPTPGRLDERQAFRLCHPGDGAPFELDLGARLEEVAIAYETYGRLDAQGSNAVLICHALTGDSHVAGHPAGDPRPGPAQATPSPAGWWEGVVGPGAPIDTRKYFVICSNILGGCRGTTGPSSIDLGTGRRYGAAFPAVTVRDMVRAQRALLDHLGVRELAAVVGGSLGGMQALEWAIAYPDLVKRAAILAAPAQAGAQAIAYNEVQRRAILSDPAWQGGQYEDGYGPQGGLALARMIAMITYQSDETLQRKFGRTPSPQTRSDCLARTGPRFEVEDYLDYQGQKLAACFDAASYLCLIRAIDLFDIARGRGGQEAALDRIRAQVLVMGVSSDILYPVHQQRSLAHALRRLGKHAHYEELTSTLGHDAFLIEIEAVGELLAGLLSHGGR